MLAHTQCTLGLAPPCIKHIDKVFMCKQQGRSWVCSRHICVLDRYSAIRSIPKYVVVHFEIRPWLRSQKYLTPIIWDRFSIDGTIQYSYGRCIVDVYQCLLLKMTRLARRRGMNCPSFVSTNRTSSSTSVADAAIIICWRAGLFFHSMAPEVDGGKAYCKGLVDTTIKLPPIICVVKQSQDKWRHNDIDQQIHHDDCLLWNECCCRMPIL